MNQSPKIIDRGRGPELEGTRITVFTILEYVRGGFDRDEIAALLRLTSQQVDAALEYIRENEAAVNTEYERIMARIGQGNPPSVEQKLKRSRKKLQAMLSRLQAKSTGDAYVGDHVRQ